MTLPAVLSTRLVTQTYTDVLGNPSVGTVTFTPVAVATAGGQIIALVPVVVTLDASGSISATLPAGDDADLAAPMYLQVVENITTASNQLGQVVARVTRLYVVQIPAGVGAVELSSLPDVVPVPAPYVTGADFVAAIAASVAAADAAASSAASAAVSASLVGAPADTAVATLLANPASETATSLSSTYVPKGSAFVSANDQGLDTANTGAANVAALQAAIDAASTFGVAEVRITKVGIYNFDSAVTLQPGTAGPGTALKGISKYVTLNYTGTGSFIVQPTPGTRGYSIALSNLAITGPGLATATVGVDLDSVSSSRFDDVVVSGFGKAWRIASAVSGGAVYNTFINCNGSGSGVGFAIEASGSNATRFFGCRANGCTTGITITDTNNTTWYGGQIEVNTTGILITASVNGLSDMNMFHGTRFENNATAWNISSTNVRYTQIVNPAAFGTYTISDTGTATTHWGITSGSAQNYMASPAQLAGGSYRFTRTANGGAETPAVVFSDSNVASGTPVTIQAETERNTGYFFRGKRGGVNYFDINCFTGGLRWLTDVTLDRVAAGTLGVGAAHCLRTGKAVTGSRPSAVTVGAGSMFYDTTLTKPIWSDGAAWRDAAGTAV